MIDCLFFSMPFFFQQPRAYIAVTLFENKIKQSKDETLLFVISSIFFLPVAVSDQ